MSEISKYEAYKKKLDNICDENNLVATISKNRYPITMTVRPLTGMDEQLSMLEEAEDEGYISPEAYIVFAYKDGNLTYKTSETITISDSLFAKLKNLYKNLHYMWLQHFHRNLIESKILNDDQLPSEYDTSDDDDEEEEDEDSDLDAEDTEDNDTEDSDVDDLLDGIPEEDDLLPDDEVAE